MTDGSILEATAEDGVPDVVMLASDAICAVKPKLLLYVVYDVNRATEREREGPVNGRGYPRRTGKRDRQASRQDNGSLRDKTNVHQRRWSQNIGRVNLPGTCRNIDTGDSAHCPHTSIYLHLEQFHLFPHGPAAAHLL